MTPEQYLERAQSEFAKIAAHSPGDKRPDDPLLCLQLDLYRWQVNHFGLQSDERFALGIIEEMGEWKTSHSQEDEADAIGDVAVFASQLATNNRLSLSAIVAIAEFCAHEKPIEEAGWLAHVVLKRGQRIRGLDDRKGYQRELTFAIAGCIASVWHTSAHLHEGLGPIILRVGREVMQRTHGHEAIPERA